MNVLIRLQQLSQKSHHFPSIILYLTPIIIGFEEKGSCHEFHSYKKMNCAYNMGKLLNDFFLVQFPEENLVLAKILIVKSIIDVCHTSFLPPNYDILYIYIYCLKLLSFITQLCNNRSKFIFILFQLVVLNIIQCPIGFKLVRLWYVINRYFYLRTYSMLHIGALPVAFTFLTLKIY